MDFTPRMQQILRRLLQETDFLSEQALADDLGISKRTVQRELEGTEKALLSYNLKLVRQKRAGIYLDGTDLDKKELSAALEDTVDMDFTDKGTRRRHLLFELLRDRTPKKLLYYSTLLGVSEATAASDLESLAPWLEKNNLKVLKKQGYGVLLTGSEKDYREAMHRFISETTSADAFKDLQNADKSLSKALANIADKGVYQLLNTHTIQRVYDVLKKMDEKKISQFTDTAKIGLIIHIAIAVERIAKGQDDDTDEEIAPILEDSEDAALARRIVAAMEDEFQLTMPPIEASYLLLHIKGAKIRYHDSDLLDLPSTVDESELLRVIDDMIEAFDTRLAYDLRCDDEFLQGLFVHLQPTIIRLQHHLNIINPILDDIKREYAEVFQKAKRAANVLSLALDTPVSDDEVGYLTIHFGAALERIKGHEAFTRSVSIGIVCASGFGIARLMMTRLKNKLPKNTNLQAYSSDAVTEEVRRQTDFFVSNLPLSIPDADVLYVSPLISPSELHRIEGKIEEYAHVRKNQPAVDTPTEDDFISTLDKTRLLSQEIAGILKNYRQYTLPEKTTFAEAVHALSSAAVEDEELSAKLFDAIITRERLNSQIFPEQDFALLHCRTTVVTQSLFYTAVPDGETFIDPYFHGISTILFLVMPQDEQSRLHTDVLGSISSSLVSDSAFAQAIHGHDEKKIRYHLQRILKVYFAKTLGL